MAAETITIDDKDYPFEEMSDQNKYLVNQIESMNRREATLKMELDQVMMAKQGFERALIASLVEPEEE